MAKPRGRINEWLVSAPSVGWLLVLFVVPTAVVFAIAFKPADPSGGIGSGWTLESLRTLANPNYPAIVWRTLWLSAATTAICIAAAVPCAYYIARARPGLRQWLLLLVVVPFWTSFLVRVFAWKILLHPEGVLKSGLLLLGLIEPDTPLLLLYNPGAVLLVMVYSYLPFAILPIYSAVEKFDWRLIEAARDLGAGRFCTFRRVFIPGISRGLMTALLVVFIPALGSYVIPDIVGGVSSEMIGNKIAQRTFVDRHLPHAAGLSALLTLAVLLPMLLVLRLQRSRGVRAAAAVEETT